MTTTEFDRYAIERTMRSYSNDITSAFDSPMRSTEETKRTVIARAQSMLSDIAYLNKIAAQIGEQVKECQKKLA